MSISLRLSQEDTEIVKSYAKLHNMSLSELFRQAVMERIEEEYDLNAYERAMKEYKQNPITYSLDEVESELGLR